MLQNSRTKSLALKFAVPAALVATAIAAMGVTSAPQSAQAQTTPVLQQAVPSLAPMLKLATPAVVNISVTAKQEIQNPLLQDPTFRRFFGVPDQQPEEQEAQSIGSGVIVDAAKGYILTNNHVVAQADTIKVRLVDDREFDAKLIGRDPDTDVALIQIKATNIKALPLADSDKLEVGDYVVAIGSPFGLRTTVTSGIVSGLGRQGMGEGGYEDFIQTDASINPGNSGGALVNLKGELIGIPSQILSRSGGNIGIGFAIPINLARSVMNQLVQYGSVERGRIGVSGQNLDPALAKAFGLPSTRGALVAEVMPGSPAEKAGLKSQDIILKADGREISTFMQLRNLVGLKRVGEKVELDILRDGKPRKVTVTIGKDTEQAATGDNLHPALAGATFAPASEGATDKGDSSKGIVIKEVAQGSAAARSGLRPGDVILSVAQQPVNTMAEFTKLASVKTGQLLLLVRRGKAAQFLLLG